MNLFKSVFTTLLLFGSATMYAQTIADVLTYTNLEVIGSARTVGVGSSLSALGSDFATISVNPGSLGNYRKSEFSLSPGININVAKSTVENGIEATTNANNLKFGFRNLGFIFHRKPVSSKWKTYNVAIGFNQLANYNRVYEYSGRTVGSIADRWLELAYDQSGAISPDFLDNFEAGLAYETGAIYDPVNDGYVEYFNDFGNAPLVLKSQKVTTKGAYNEVVIAFAGNYNNKLSIGASLGIPIVNFTYKKIYEEMDDGAGKDGDIEFFNSLKFVEDLNTSGVGINIKAGATYRVSQALRFGIGFHSPMNLRLTDLYYNKTTYNFTGLNGLDEELEAESPDGNFDYRLRTPMRVIGSAAYIFGKRGFVSAEVEYLDFAATQFDLTRNSNSSEDELYQRQLNEEVASTYGVATNIRVGGEIVLSSWRLRAGLGLIADPYAIESRFDQQYSFGGGYRGDSFYFDLAYRLFSYEQRASPYNLVDDALEPVVVIDGLNNQIVSTIGFRF